MVFSPQREALFQVAKEQIYRYSENPFLLASGKESHHYFNCKKITLHPQYGLMLARIIRDEIFEQAGIVELQAVGGLTMGADPIAYSLGYVYQERSRIVYPLIVRKEAKDHGTGQRIEGEIDRVSSVVLLDDVVTTAGSSIKAVKAFREAGIVVDKAVCIIDRQEGGREALKEEGIELFSVFQKSDFGHTEKS